jgi:hypothetical protein
MGLGSLNKKETKCKRKYVQKTITSNGKGRRELDVTEWRYMDAKGDELVGPGEKKKPSKR